MFYPGFSFKALFNRLNFFQILFLISAPSASADYILNDTLTAIRMIDAEIFYLKRSSQVTVFPISNKAAFNSPEKAYQLSRKQFRHNRAKANEVVDTFHMARSSQSRPSFENANGGALFLASRQLLIEELIQHLNTLRTILTNRLHILSENQSDAQPSSPSKNTKFQLDSRFFEKEDEAQDRLIDYIRIEPSIGKVIVIEKLPTYAVIRHLRKSNIEDIEETIRRINIRIIDLSRRQEIVNKNANQVTLQEKMKVVATQIPNGAQLVSIHELLIMSCQETIAFLNSLTPLFEPHKKPIEIIKPLEPVSKPATTATTATTTTTTTTVTTPHLPPLSPSTLSVPSPNSDSDSDSEEQASTWEKLEQKESKPFIYTAEEEEKSFYWEEESKQKEIEFLKKPIYLVQEEETQKKTSKKYILKRKDYDSFLVLMGKDQAPLRDRDLLRVLAALLKQSEGQGDYLGYAGKGSKVNVRVNGHLFYFDVTHGRDSGRVYRDKIDHVREQLDVAGISLENVFEI